MCTSTCGPTSSSTGCARNRAPYLRDWTLVTDGEPSYDVNPGDHDVASRITADEEAGVTLSCLNLSSPLGIEGLPSAEAAPLLNAWHSGVRELPSHFKAWASVPNVDRDVPGLIELLRDDRFVGVQLPATELSSPDAWEQAAQVLVHAEIADKPVFVHPGPVARPTISTHTPDWWAPVVGYVGQMHAAWWAWEAIGGRKQFPQLRLVFGAAAGLAPVHHERHALRGGTGSTIDPNVFVDTSCYGSQALDTLVRVLGIDQLVLGSDRPYGEPLTEFLGAAATRAVRTTNPARLLGATARANAERGELQWANAS